MKVAWAALVGAVAVLLLGALGAGLLAWSGVYDVSVTAQHTQPVFSMLEGAMRQSVRLHGRGMPAPPPDLSQRVGRGAQCFRDKCVLCHGAPGVAPAEFGLSMQPLPGPLVDAAERLDTRELYWIVRNGVKMSGMPAWQHRMDDADLWAVVAFVETLPTLSPQDYRTLIERQPRLQCDAASGTAAATGDARRGRQALQQNGCTSCHVVPGVTGSDVHVGPPLRGIASRGLIAGRVPNTTEQMVRWIRDPKSIDPLTAMPMLGVSEQDARDIAAHLATLH